MNLINKEISRLKKIKRKLDKYSDAFCFVPFDIVAIKNHALTNENNSGELIENQEWAILKIENFVNSLPEAIYGPNCSDYELEIINERIEFAKILIYSNLASKQIITSEMRRPCLKFILDKIKISMVLSTISPGEQIGTCTATGFASGATQMALDSFHSAGHAESNVTQQGATQLQQLIQATTNKKTSSATLYLPKRYSKSRKHVEKIAKIFTKTKIGDFIKKIELIEDIDLLLNKTAIPEDGPRLKYYKRKIGIPTLTSKRCLRIEFSKSLLYRKKITIDEIMLSIIKTYEDTILIPLGELILRIYSKQVPDLEYLINLMNEIKLISVTGVPSVEGVYYDPMPVTVGDNKEFVLYTKGTNLEKIIKLPGIDKKRFLTTDINEAYEIFGIEGARSLIFFNIEKILRSNSIGVNPDIISTIADFMTYSGRLLGLKWHGMNKSMDIEPLQKISHERYEQFITQSAIHGYTDNIKSPASSIITGKLGNYGTGLSDLELSI